MQYLETNITVSENTSFIYGYNAFCSVHPSIQPSSFLVSAAGHYPELVARGEGRNVDRPVNGLALI